jgi:hypothetical protein
MAPRMGPSIELPPLSMLLPCRGLEWYQYPPWVITISFIIICTGLGLWAASSTEAINATSAALMSLGIKGSYFASLQTWGKGWVLALTFLYSTMVSWRREGEKNALREIRAGRERGAVTQCSNFTPGLFMVSLMPCTTGQREPGRGHLPESDQSPRTLHG